MDKHVINTEDIRKIVLVIPEVKDVHQSRSRGREDALYIDLHVMTDPAMSVLESHTLQHNIESKLREELSENTEVIAHLEPYYKGGKEEEK